jgi:hypothetical protein
VRGNPLAAMNTSATQHNAAGGFAAESAVLRSYAS